VPDVSVPMATSTGWASAASRLVFDDESLWGRISVSATKADREAAGIRGRRSPSVTIATTTLRSCGPPRRGDQGRYLLPDDMENVVKRGEAQWELLMGKTSTASK
jgi:hypothetical protein